MKNGYVLDLRMIFTGTRRVVAPPVTCVPNVEFDEGALVQKVKYVVLDHAKLGCTCRSSIAKKCCRAFVCCKVVSLRVVSRDVKMSSIDFG